MRTKYMCDIASIRSVWKWTDTYLSNWHGAEYVEKDKWTVGVVITNQVPMW